MFGPEDHAPDTRRDGGFDERLSHQHTEEGAREEPADLDGKEGGGEFDQFAIGILSDVS